MRETCRAPPFVLFVSRDRVRARAHALAAAVGICRVMSLPAEGLRPGDGYGRGYEWCGFCHLRRPAACVGRGGVESSRERRSSRSAVAPCLWSPHFRSGVQGRGRNSRNAMPWLGLCPWRLGTTILSLALPHLFVRAPTVLGRRLRPSIHPSIQPTSLHSGPLLPSLSSFFLTFRLIPGIAIYVLCSASAHSSKTGSSSSSSRDVPSLHLPRHLGSLAFHPGAHFHPCSSRSTCYSMGASPSI